MSSRLHVTFALVLFALAAVVPMAVLVGLPMAHLLVPRWQGAVRVLPSTDRPVVGEVRPGEVDADGLTFFLTADERGTWVFASPCRGTLEGGRACYALVTSWTASPGDLRILRHGEGVYTVAPRSGPSTVLAVRKAERVWPSLPNLASPLALPSLIGLVSIGALLVALGRARLAVAYARRMTSWKPLVLTREGMLQDDGATVGTVQRGARVRAGDVIVAPEALEGASVYRELAIVPRHAMAPGSHARWARGTERRLRDARVLSIVATLASAIALFVHFAA